MQRGNITKYKAFARLSLPDREWPSRVTTQAPTWCSVDLRDGNQSLAIPMGIAEKLEMFDLLVRVGFKEIEVGFPSASEIEFNFIRRLIEEKRIPDDVAIQVITQCREHLIRRTFESIEGAKNVILHLYNSTSPLQRRITFGMDRTQIKEIAVSGTRIVKRFASEFKGGKLRFEYSPESFSDTETDYALEVCEAVMDVWEPTEKDPLILNLPDTVEWAGPHVYADQIEWICRNMKERRKAIISLHTHNDRGTGVAATELGLLAGADRVEGTLFGNGERTGNLDIVTVALNLYMHGIDPKLDLSDVPAIRRVYERCTRMDVPPRHPYAGDLVFTAFSGSHQDAIKKGMDQRATQKEGDPTWAVPYLTIDPQDIGRTYEAIIRINSQSGKGGVAYVLSREFGLDLPKNMHPEIGTLVNRVADRTGRELTPQEIYEVFQREYLLREKPLKLIDYDVHPSGMSGHHRVTCSAKVEFKDKTYEIRGDGNGPINAFVQAMANMSWKHFRVLDYRSHAIGAGSATDSAAYIELEREGDRTRFWGTGIDSNIEQAGIKALVSAYNRAFEE